MQDIGGRGKWYPLGSKPHGKLGDLGIIPCSGAHSGLGACPPRTILKKIDVLRLNLRTFEY